MGRAVRACEAVTRRAIERDVFAMPFHRLDGEPFRGQDRLEFLERALLAGSRAQPAVRAGGPGRRSGPPVRTGTGGRRSAAARSLVPAQTAPAACRRSTSSEA